MRAAGTFEVKLQPLDSYASGGAGAQLGRLSIDKTFSGDLAATSQGEMLSARTAVEGSAAYVALEHVTGTLHGRRGSFALQHFGVMRGGQNRLILEIVPDSGTDELVNLSGQMGIRVEDGHHFYTLDYSLA